MNDASLEISRAGDTAILTAHGIPAIGSGPRIDTLADFAFKRGWHLSVAHSGPTWVARVREAVVCPSCRHWLGEAATEEAAIAHAIASALEAGARTLGPPIHWRADGDWTLRPS